MRLLRAWLAAAAIVVAGLVLDSVAVLIAARHGGSSAAVQTVLLVHLPWTLIVVTATVVASVVHGEQRLNVQHLLAAFGVPIVAIVGSVALGAAQGTVWGGTISAAEVILGAALGWLVRRRFTRRDQGSYFPA